MNENISCRKAAFDAVASNMLAAGVLFCTPLFMLSASFAQAASDTQTTSIERGSEEAKQKKMNEPSYETREQRLKAQPLDWNKTIGKPEHPPKLSHADEAKQRKAKPGSAAGGSPDPNANDEARKLHPEDWR
jgi:hypothetical protein